MIHSIWKLSALYCISTYLLFFRALFILQHLCYYLNKTTPYRWNLTLYIVYIFTIHLSFLRPINHNYSWLLFDYIAYSANNMGRRCVIVIYRKKCKCNALIIIPVLFFYRVVYRCTLTLYIVYIFTIYLSF